MSIQNIDIHEASLKGLRKENEDEHTVIANLDMRDKKKAPVNCYAVYDGHGGNFVSAFLKEHIPACFVDKRVSYPLEKKFIKQAYTYLHKKLSGEYQKEALNTGSTCLLILHYKNKSDSAHYLNVINTGDSRAIICRKNIAIALTKDHKPNWPEESRRIKDLGGEIIFDGYDWRISDLSVSRAFGDLSSVPYLTCTPDVFRYKLTNDDKFIVLACDGLWDVLSNQDVVNYILDNCYDIKTGLRINKHIKMGKRLADYAIAKGSTDNVTVVIVFFE